MYLFNISILYFFMVSAKVFFENFRYMFPLKVSLEDFYERLLLKNSVWCGSFGAGFYLKINPNENFSMIFILVRGVVSFSILGNSFF